MNKGFHMKQNPVSSNSRARKFILPDNIRQSILNIIGVGKFDLPYSEIRWLESQIANLSEVKECECKECEVEKPVKND